MKIKYFLRKGANSAVQMTAAGLLAFLIVILSFSTGYGFDETLAAFGQGIFNIHNVGDIINAQEGEQAKVLGSAISGTGDELYEDFEPSNFQVKPLSVVAQKNSALVTPTSGIAAHPDFLFTESHPGVDIWTSVNGKGLNGSPKGNPVYSACGGEVIRIFEPNQEIEIKCDLLPEEFSSVLPSVNIKILYAHLGDGVTKQAYHNLSLGQRLEKGELVGYQGNISSFVPRNKVTHLHFGVYDLNVRRSLNPAPYIGLDQVGVGQMFEALK